MVADLPDLAVLAASERAEIGTADNDDHGEASTFLWPLGAAVAQPLCTPSGANQLRVAKARGFAARASFAPGNAPPDTLRVRPVQQVARAPAGRSSGQ